MISAYDKFSRDCPATALNEGHIATVCLIKVVWTVVKQRCVTRAAPCPKT